jgi:Cdc6-like AAA superfamily ATPase
MFKKRAAGTRTWLFGNITVKRWLQNRQDPSVAGMLWVNGRPGSGKSVLSAILMEHLIRANKAPIAYFYCDSGNEQLKSTLNICGSILSQIAVQMEVFPTSILEAYGRAKKYGRKHISSSEDLFSVLSDVLSSSPNAYIVLDGIDECEGPPELTKNFANIAIEFKALRLA